ncbi:MAG TPA: HTH domain-containing protein [Polyangiales bacterium]|nr:HTH domain-containing protein [Polyangiales bacterium]
MNEVREVIRRWRANQSLREMARETDLDRKTVRRYIEVLRGLGVAPDVALEDGLVHETARRSVAVDDDATRLRAGATV